MTAQLVSPTSVIPAIRPFLVLLVSVFLVACDSGGGPDASDPADAEWAGTWNVRSTTTQTSVGEITTVYDDIGLSMYWILRTDYVETITAVEGEDGCGQVRSEVLDVDGRVVTLDNGVYVFDIEYVVSGDQLTATVVASDEEPDLVGARWDAVAAEGDARSLAGC